MEVVIRRIQASDYPQVASLWQSELGNRYVNPETIASDYEKMSKKEEYATLVALLQGRVVGFITTVQVLAVGLPVGYLKINGLAVEKEHQRMGIGTKLLKYVENDAAEKGVSFVLLNSGFKRAQAHAFYERHGYSKDSYCFDKALSHEE